MAHVHEKGFHVTKNQSENALARFYSLVDKTLLGMCLIKVTISQEIPHNNMGYSQFIYVKHT